MRLCTALRGSNAIYRRPRALPHASRTYSSDALASARHNGPKAARDRKPGEGHEVDINTDSKVVDTVVGELPLSPVMDHTFWEARDRFGKRKPKSGLAANEFEREFRMNPFARALATPVRVDLLTKSRLPSFFLQGFNMVAHPETGVPWWVPQDLTADERSSDGAQLAERVNGASPEAVLSTGTYGLPPGTARARKSPTATAVKQTPRGPTGHFLARHDLLHSVGKPASANAHLHKRLFVLSQPKLRQLLQNVQWREDMDAYILKEMRRQIFREILFLSNLCTTAGRDYIVRCLGWDDVKFKCQGAVLWFGESSKLGNRGTREAIPGPVATTDLAMSNRSIMKTSILVHNIPMLLGAEYTEKLRNEAAVVRDGSIFMLAGRRTTGLQMSLWKLQGYLYHSS